MSGAPQETHYVICAVRNVEKMEEIAAEAGWDKKAYKVMPLQLSSLEDCKGFVKRFRKLGKTLDCLCCNAAVYLPNQPGPTWTEDGFEESVGVNHLSHFLLCNLMIADLKKSKEPRCIIVGSITGNTNTVRFTTLHPLKRRPRAPCRLRQKELAAGHILNRRASLAATADDPAGGRATTQVGGGAVKPFADLGDLKGLARGVSERDGEVSNLPTFFPAPAVTAIDATRLPYSMGGCTSQRTCKRAAGLASTPPPSG